MRPKKIREKPPSKTVLILTLCAAVVLLYTALPYFKELTENVKRTERIPFPRPQMVAKPHEPSADDFVGAEACAECHEQEYKLWRASTHGLAGGAPSAKTVIGNFKGATLRFKNAEVTPVVTSNGAYKFIIEAQGFAKQEIEVAAVIGKGHMLGGGTQSYFSQFPDGTLRFLPFDFIRQENLWFCQVRGSNHWIPISKDMSLSELSQWPPSRILGEESGFSNCQNCHGSQIQVYYDLHKKRYVTKYQSLSINCESCHGPGKRHIALTKSDSIENMVDIGMKALSTLSKDSSLNVCFQCHAIKDRIEDGYLPGKELEHYYSLRFPILGDNPYLEDGRVRAFAYQQNHLFSDCYLNGSMTCVDCHDPHSQKYRDIYGRQLQGRFDNGQCLGCHASKRHAPESHSRHKPDSPGNVCTACHMPYLQHQRVGSRLRFARSDHTIPIPRPQFDAKLGIENACKKCHQDKSIDWLQAKTDAWYRQIKPHNGSIEGLLQAQNVHDRKTASALLLGNELMPSRGSRTSVQPSGRHTMAQVAGLIYFIKRFLLPDMPDLEPEIIKRLKGLTESEDLDLKALALASLHLAADTRSDVHTFLLSRLRNLGMQGAGVRTRWAMALDHLGSTYSLSGDVENAVTCYNKAIEINPEDAVTYANLALVYVKKGDLETAVVTYQKAIETDPSYTAAHIGLGNLCLKSGAFRQAADYYRQAIDIKPSDPAAHFLLGQLYLLTGQKEEAINALQAGLKYAPFDVKARSVLQKLRLP